MSRRRAGEPAGDLRTIRVDSFLPYPPAKVWRALTEPALLARWFMQCDFRLEVGHRFTFRTEPKPAVGFGGLCHSEVLDFEVEKLLRLRWDDPGEDNGLRSTVTYRLEPEGTGTRLFIEHDGFDPDNPYQQMSRRIMGAPNGWSGAAARLAAALERQD